jgi:DsbC/DsbD-like thiol-disulfide interchange protein
LVIEQSAVTPGSKVNVGIQFQSDPDWHIYWQNPGDSGEPPRMQWQLPAGVTAGALEWPTPMRLTTSAGADFGYQGTTVLLSSLQIPTTPLSGTMTVGGDLHWIVCHDICIPQSTHLEAPIRIASATSIDNSAHHLLQSAAKHLPLPLPASYRPEVASSGDNYQLTFIPSQPITQAEFFPGDKAVLDNGAPQEFASHARKVSLTLRKSEYFRQEPERLRGVLVLNRRDAYRVDVRIHRSGTHEGSRQH